MIIIVRGRSAEFHVVGLLAKERFAGHRALSGDPADFGSAFNIWYNIAVVDPLLTTAALKERFIRTVIAYNSICYPIGVYGWLRLRLFVAAGVGPDRSGSVPGRGNPDPSASPCHSSSLVGRAGGRSRLAALHPRIPSLPCSSAGSVRRAVALAFADLFGVSAFIAITHSFFLVELASHRGLFPPFFRDTRADRTPGAIALSLRGRGVLWAISAGICPIGSLLLLSFAPPSPGSDPQWFAVFVGAVGIAFGILTAILISRLVAEPVDHLRAAAQAVARGQLDVRVPMLRADEFGLLIGEFNHMVSELREKERLRQTFGLHVGRQAAEEILARDPGLGGVDQVITVMFVDIRSFTSRSAGIPPSEVVRGLNQFLSVMVQVVEEQHGGLINKFLGDGFMALFGVGDPSSLHADAALAAAGNMLAALHDLNATLARQGDEPIEIGIGIHSGPAVIGSIGSPQRLEFTAIGATVNIAARVEGLTKTTGEPLLFTRGTRECLKSHLPVRELPVQQIRGMDQPIAVFTLLRSPLP